MEIGAKYLRDGRCRFALWAPIPKDIALKIVFPREQIIPLKRDESGFFSIEVDNIVPGTHYFYRVNGSRDLPDPASYFQPQGVHGPSQVIDHSEFAWRDQERPFIYLENMIIYEVHVGTFTPQGTFKAIIPRLDKLKELGVNALEIMPVAQFPGERNWGYDGAYPFSVQNSYGGPEGLKELVSEAHRRGMAVILDVVYNHLGPEGNYLSNFGPYFSSKYKTPWGGAINFDGRDNEGVRNYFIENALFWFREYHFDALRLDAIHGIYDESELPFLQQLAERVERFSKEGGRKYYLIAESDLNDSRVIRSREKDGYGLDAQWNDDFHHAVHALLTGEREGYYADFGKLDHLIKAFREGYVYSGEYSVYRQRNHGNSSADIPAEKFIVFIQNHDQTGNRMGGERLSKLVGFEALKLAAGVLFTTPYIPLIFMGEEYAEEAPFLYFASHFDENLIKSTKESRKEQFAEAFHWQGEPLDPQDVGTFLKSKLKWEDRDESRHKIMLEFYRHLIKLRKEIPALANLGKDNQKLDEREGKILVLERWHMKSRMTAVFNFSGQECSLRIKKSGRKVVDSSDRIWGGAGPTAPQEILNSMKIDLLPYNFVLYKMEE